MKRIKRELSIFLFLFVALSIAMHYEAWFHHPAEHLAALPSSPLGPFHPLVIVTGIYIAIVMVRLAIGMARRILSREK